MRGNAHRRNELVTERNCCRTIASSLQENMRKLYQMYEIMIAFIANKSSLQLTFGSTHAPHASLELDRSCFLNVLSFCIRIQTDRCDSDSLLSSTSLASSMKYNEISVQASKPKFKLLLYLTASFFIIILLFYYILTHAIFIE
jgi:hypothetical protein